MTTKLFALLLALLLTGCAPKEDTNPVQTPPAASEEASAPADAPADGVSAPVPPSSDAPANGMNRTVNYNNCRYTLLSSKQSPLPETLSLGEPLETLPDRTVLYAHPDYHPEFRLIVQSDGQMQLAELSGSLGEEKISVSYWLEHSQVEQNAVSFSVLNHNGTEVLKEAQLSLLPDLLKSLSQAVPAQLDSPQYEEIAAEQSAGRSYRLCFTFADGTSSFLYCLPELELISLANGYYRLPESFVSDYSSLFSDLPASPPPAY